MGSSPCISMPCFFFLSFFLSFLFPLQSVQLSLAGLYTSHVRFHRWIGCGRQRWVWLTLGHKQGQFLLWLFWEEQKNISWPPLWEESNCCHFRQTEGKGEILRERECMCGRFALLIHTRVVGSCNDSSVMTFFSCFSTSCQTWETTTLQPTEYPWTNSLLFLITSIFNNLHYVNVKTLIVSMCA